jgi:hypothetical protein
MARRSFTPPTTGDAGLNAWMRAVSDQLAHLPLFSIISTADGPNSLGVLGEPATIAVEIGSSATKLWQKRSASTSTIGWSHFSWL